MIIKSLKILSSAIIISLTLLLLSYTISFFIKDSAKSLDLILFIVGAILVVFFGSELFTQSTSGALHTPKVNWRLFGSSNQNKDGSHSGALLIPQVIYRLVGSSNQNKNESQADVEKKPNFAASISLVLSGVILWTVSYFI
jgi:formate/nitrite transporter FocA (FNT family)